MLPRSSSHHTLQKRHTDSTRTRIKDLEVTKIKDKEPRSQQSLTKDNAPSCVSSWVSDYLRAFVAFVTQCQTCLFYAACNLHANLNFRWLGEKCQILISSFNWLQLASDKFLIKFPIALVSQITQPKLVFSACYSTEHKFMLKPAALDFSLTSN